MVRTHNFAIGECLGRQERDSSGRGVGRRDQGPPKLIHAGVTAMVDFGGYGEGFCSD